MNLLGNKHNFNIRMFHNIVFRGEKVQLCLDSRLRMEETRGFINFLLEENIKSYGITTGFADLKTCSISPEQADELSCNLIESHDAGIGASFSPEIILGAMIARAASLSKGYSGFQVDSLQTLIDMINHKIIPLIPKTGSLGASGDLCMLARLARAMEGKKVPVWYKGKLTTANKALKEAGIAIFRPKAKEGLAMINGTSFMVSMIAIAFLQEIHELENILGMQGLFLNSVGATDAAFNSCMHEIRPQKGQKLVAEIISQHFNNSEFIDFKEMQNDYCIRCIPQILGPKIESILEQYLKIENELDSVTDNPLFFREEELTEDVHSSRKIFWNHKNWVVLSGGNFHGECISTIVDVITAANAKIAITLERQISYMLNPARNKKLPCYLIPDKNQIGLSSGYMITQYAANSLVQKICQLSNPTSNFNITSGNESEDVVSYGSNAAEKLLEQIKYLQELNSIYLTVAIQAYSITRETHISLNKAISEELLAEKIFQDFQDFTQDAYPIEKDANFDTRYSQAKQMLASNKLRKIMDYPLYKGIQNRNSDLVFFDKDMCFHMDHFK